MAGIRMPGGMGQISALVSAGQDLPPALAALVGNQPQGQPLTNSGGAMASADPMRMAPHAVQSFNFRRNYASGGLVGPEQGPPMPGEQPLEAGALEAEVQRVAQANPQVVQQLQQEIMAALQSGQLTMEQLNLAVQLARTVAQNPALYPRLRELAIQRGLADEDELPPQYDQGIVFAILLAGQAAMQQGAPQGAPAGPPAGAPAGPPGAPAGNFAEGGSIPVGRSPSKDKSGTADDININVSGGEYVIPKHVVAAKGTEFFDRMLDQYDPNNPESKVNKSK